MAKVTRFSRPSSMRVTWVYCLLVHSNLFTASFLCSFGVARVMPA
jgi:hypothetical protein